MGGFRNDEDFEFDLTIVSESDPDGHWIIASIPEVHAARRQGRNREEARKIVLSALGD